MLDSYQREIRRVAFSLILYFFLILEVYLCRSKVIKRLVESLVVVTGEVVLNSFPELVIT